mmetsp:Transcript_52944/g.114521  ORF Transcript_52944/g.114521 Transcript_52944/m.114521 type:complete len:221 (-) Transcript_52944:1024-1686(-)
MTGARFTGSLESTPFTASKIGFRDRSILPIASITDCRSTTGFTSIPSIAPRTGERSTGGLLSMRRTTSDVDARSAAMWLSAEVTPSSTLPMSPDTESRRSSSLPVILRSSPATTFNTGERSTSGLASILWAASFSDCNSAVCFDSESMIARKISPKSILERTLWESSPILMARLTWVWVLVCASPTAFSTGFRSTSGLASMRLTHAWRGSKPFQKAFITD